MAKSDNQILLGQTFWLKMNVFLLLLAGGLISFDYLEQRQTIKANSVNIASHETRISVLESQRDLKINAGYKK